MPRSLVVVQCHNYNGDLLRCEHQMVKKQDNLVQGKICRVFNGFGLVSQTPNVHGGDMICCDGRV